MSGQGLRILEQFLRGTAEDHLPPMFSRPRAHIDNIIGGKNGIGIMFDDQDRVPDIPQGFQGLQEPEIVPGVESDTGFIQDIKDPHQMRADLGGQPDTLSFSAGQGGRGPIEGQVIQSYIGQKFQAVIDLFQYSTGDLSLPGVKLQVVKPDPASFTEKDVT